MTTAVSLSDFRAELRRRGLDAFMVPMDDAHMGEYSPPSERRIAALSGFKGSAGFLVVSQSQALIWTDSRYLIAIKTEVDAADWRIRDINADPPLGGLQDFISPGETLGYDPAVQTRASVEQWTRALNRIDARLSPVADNPVDALWARQPVPQPQPPATPVFPHPLSFTGKSSADKRTEIGADLAAAGLSAQVLNQSESVAWLLNARADDIDGLPVARSMATLYADGTVDWFIDPARLSQAMHEALDNRVALYHPQDMSARLRAMDGTVGIDHKTCNAAIFNALKDGGVSTRNNADPVVLPRALKNPVEQQGARDAQRRDARAVIRFSRWLSQHPRLDTLTERDVIDKILSFREQNDDPVPMNGASFGTIAGVGANAALAHYAVTEASNTRLQPGLMLLVDSGGQYHNGTTDITRVWALGGQSTARQRRDYSLTLKGHLAIERCQFPEGTTGHQIDVLARQFMWREGLDFSHGTGHGIGAYLSVHEGPQSISKRPGSAPLQAGMLLSNEPGLYREGESGVRIENVELVVRKDPGFLGFETLTLVPYDTTLIERSLLTGEERDQIDAYHARILAEVGPDLSGDDLTYLQQATAPLQ